MSNSLTKQNAISMRLNCDFRHLRAPTPYTNDLGDTI